MQATAQYVYRWLCALCLLLPLFASAAPFHLTLDRGQLSATIEGRPDSMAVGTRSLPWRSDYEFNRQDGVAHFDFQFALSQSQWEDLQVNEAGLGLFGLQLGSRYRFRFNGGNWTEVGWSESSQYRSRPRWHLIPRSHIASQTQNKFELELRFAAASDSGLSKIEVAEVGATLATFQRESNLRYFSALVAGASSLLISLLAFSMWLASRERFFVLTALAELLFALRQTGIFIDYPPLPTWLWNALHAEFFAAYVGLICLASLILAPSLALPSIPVPRLRQVLNSFLILSIPTLAVGHWWGEYRVYLACLFAMLALTLICVLRISRAAWTSTDINVRLFAIGAWVALLLGVYDFVVISVLPSGLGFFRFGVFSSVLFNLSIAVIIVRRYQITKRDLSQSRLLAKTDAERATLLERQRIMSDIHDTVGSQLVSVLGMIRSGAPHAQLETETSDALEDLRIAIDAIQPVNGNLTAVLATLRHRLEPRIEAHGLELIWQVDALPRFNHMSPQIVQHVQRIILEVMTNTLKHAHASRITLSANVQKDDKAPTDSVVVIRIADDGLGFREQLLQTQGQGLHNIRMRAAVIKAQVAIDSQVLQGTAITLTFHVDK